MSILSQLRRSFLSKRCFPSPIPCGIARLKVLPLNNSNSRKLLALDRSPNAGGERIIFAHASMHRCCSGCCTFGPFARGVFSLLLSAPRSLDARALAPGIRSCTKSHFHAPWMVARPATWPLAKQATTGEETRAGPRVQGDHVVQFEKSMHTRASH